GEPLVHRWTSGLMLHFRPTNSRLQTMTRSPSTPASYRDTFTSTQLPRLVPARTHRAFTGGAVVLCAMVAGLACSQGETPPTTAVPPGSNPSPTPVSPTGSGGETSTTGGSPTNGMTTGTDAPPAEIPPGTWEEGLT